MNWKTNIEILNRCLFEVFFRNIEGKEMDSDAGFSEWLERTQNVRQSNNTIFFVGNGASASMACHFSADVAKNGN